MAGENPAKEMKGQFIPIWGDEALGGYFPAST